jgi:DNA-binding CsgD family transcriptional regulator
MAWLFHNEGDKDKEITHLRKALERAKKFQHNHFLIQEGKITLPLLLTALCEEITPGYVTWVLNKIGSKSLDIVEALINSDKIGLRLRAIDLMDNFKCESSLPLLRKASRDSDERVKEAAIRIARDIRKDLKKPDNILSQREIQVMELIATGITNKRIAEKLYISEVTVKTHLTNIFRKLGLSSRLEAGLYYQEFIKNNTFGVTDSYR